MFVRGKIWGETIKVHHCKTEVQNNIYWSPEKFNINIPSQPPAVLNKAFYPKTSNEEY